MFRKDSLRGARSHHRRRASALRDQRRFGPCLEALEEKALLAVSIAPDPGVQGQFQVWFDADYQYENDTLNLRGNDEGLLSYSLNGSLPTTDLDSFVDGPQELQFSQISRIIVTLGLGFNRLNVDHSHGMVTSDSTVIDFQGNSSEYSESYVYDLLYVDGADADYTVTDTLLTSPQVGNINLTFVDEVRVFSGASNNVLDASQFSGKVSLDGGAGDDVLRGGLGDDYLDGSDGDDTVYGGDGDDTIWGSHGNDTLYGGNGDDLLQGLEGVDTLYGEDGSDTLQGGDENDTVYGGLGGDWIYGENGDDVLWGEEGSDRIYGDAGSDQIKGGDGDDDLSGGVGEDVVEGGDGNDELAGGGDDDILNGGIGDDSLEGGSGSDTLLGGTGADRVVARADADFILTDSGLDIVGVELDTLVGIELASLYGGSSPNVIDTSAFSGVATLDGGGGSDVLKGSNSGTTFTGTVAPTDDITLYGGTGVNEFAFDVQGRIAIVDNGGQNTLNLTSTGEGITLDLRINDGTDQTVTTSGGKVSLTGKFQKVYGTAFGDTIWGDAFGTILYGGLGSDTINGGSGADTIYGGTGPGDTDASDDVIYGGLGADIIDGGNGNDVIYGGTGVDDIDLSPDTIYGGLGTDVIFGGNNNDTIYGGTGPGSSDADASNDVIYGGLGTDVIDGGAGNDTIYGGTATGSADLDGSDDTIYGGLGSDAIDGGKGDDTIYGGIGGVGDPDTSNDLIYGGLGTDVIDGGGGNDTIYGGTAGGVGDVDTSNDTIYGGLGSDTVDGGTGADTIYGGTAGGVDDQDSSADTIYGGLGGDILDGGRGSDTIYGGTTGGVNDSDGSADTIYGGLGGDIIDGGNGADTIYGGTAGGGLDVDTDADTIYGGLGSDTIDAGGGNDTIFGGIASGGVGGDSSNDTIFGGAGSDLLAGEGGDDQLDGGAGNDRYLFAGLGLGNDLILEAPSADRDTLDFSAFGAPVTIDLSRTDKQTVGGTDLAVTLWSTTSIEDVDGTRFNDKITGNGRDNQIRGADFLDQRDGAGLGWDGRTQLIYLDFDTNTGIDYQGKPKAEHVYTTPERDAIQQYIQAAFAGFHVVVTQSLPGSGAYATLSFNDTPVYGGGPQPGGIADEVDLGNRNLGGKALIDVNDLLGKPSQPAATSANFVSMSATIATHEMGHLLGLRHADSFGPIGSGMHNPPGADSTRPAYPGPEAAAETTWHLMASPASVGASLFDTLANPFFGEREAIKLAYAMAGGPVVAEAAGEKGSIGTAQVLGWTALDVQNTLKRGLNSFKDLAASFGAVAGSIGLTGGGTSEDDYYAFTARAGDLINLDLYSITLERLATKIDSVVRVLDSAGNGIPFFAGTAENDDSFENQDSSIIDLTIPADGTYYIVVDTFTSVDVPDTGAGDYELFFYRFDAGNAVSGNDWLSGGLGANSLQGGRGDDTYFGAGLGIDTATDLGGTDKLDFSAMSTGIAINLSQSAGQKQVVAGRGTVQLYGTFENVAGSAHNDTITGNAANNVLIGNDGDDVIVGGSGRDLLVGGNGADKLDGGADDDILIGGRTTFDAQDAALAAIMAEWTSNSAYSVRVARISGQATGGANGTTILVRGTTIIDSVGPDTLTGAGGLDLFYIPNKNRVAGKEAGEVIL